MASMIQLRLPQGNTVMKQFNAFNGTAAADLTGYNIRMIIKDSETASDEAGDSVTISGTISGDPSLGVLQVSIPGSDLPQAEELWYRIDAVLESDSTQYFTIAKGPLYIEPV